tara:strand:- start:38 stop:337 length:300 start_codon:yes stop_codon:yes gene_type:complete
VSLFRRNGLGVVKVRLERALVPGLHIRDAFANCDDFQSEFMSGSARIGEERELPKITGKVGAADSHPMSSDESFSRSGRFDVGEINGVDLFDVGEFNGV